MAPKKVSTKEDGIVDEAMPQVEGKKEEVQGEPSPKKAKVAEKAEAAPVEKKGEEDETKEEPAKPKEPEKPKELEVDSPADKRKKLDADAVGINMADATLNVLPVAGRKILMSLSEGGCQYLLASARASVGVKAGRYMFEVTVAEQLNPAEPPAAQGVRTPQPRQLVRIGFSLSNSSLFLSDTLDNVCFDSEGNFIHEKKRTRVSQKFACGQTVAVVLNLDGSSPNANTVSLFRDGVRISEPQPLPENLRGKTLFPTITYRNVSVETNFGPVARTALPFACRMLADAAVADVDANLNAIRAGEPAKQCNVLFPIGMPEQGYFDWVDNFLAKNPSYVELSDRRIAEWATKSGIWHRGQAPSTSSNDKPDFKFGIPFMDDDSIKRVITNVAPMLGRNYVVPELHANLLADDRKKVLRRFAGPGFKRTATVVMGEPNQQYKEKVQALLLADKVGKRDDSNKKKVYEAERKRLLDEKKRRAEAARKEKEAAQRKKEGKEEEVADEKEDEVKEEAKEDVTDDAPVELTAEEKAIWYRKFVAPDITARLLTTSYAKFSLPTAAEGFDDVTYEWQTEAKCKKLLSDYIHEQKMTQRVEDLQPGEWFTGEWAKWQKTLSEWKKRQAEFKDPTKKKAYMEKKKAEARKKNEEEGKDADEGIEPMQIDVDDIDVFSVEDVSDLGNGEPLFAHFLYEDWVLMNARVEFHILVHAFKKDLNDSDRPSFGENHILFYYHKYFKKNFNLKIFNVEKFSDFVEFIKDALAINDKKLLQALKGEAEPLTSFLKLAEEHRRERTRREDAGDETAKLKFSRPAAAPPAGPPRGPAGGPMGRVPMQPTRAGMPQQPQHPLQYGRPAFQPAGPYGQMKRPMMPSYAPSSVYGQAQQFRG